MKEGMKRKPNQCERIIDYINTFGGITSYEAYTDLGVTQLATRIFELKQQGYIFQKQNVKKKNRYGEQVSFSKYTLV